MNLYLREPIASVKEWLDSEIKVLWNFQKPDGIIEGWHGDGNFARTSLMYALWKTAGTQLSNWNQEVMYGAVAEKNAVYITLSSLKAWAGKLVFGGQWHKQNLHLPFDYPRINQFQEWFPIEANKSYELTIDGKSLNVKGSVLLAGYPLQLKPQQTIQVRCKR